MRVCTILVIDRLNDITTKIHYLLSEYIHLIHTITKVTYFFLKFLTLSLS